MQCLNNMQVQCDAKLGTLAVTKSENSKQERTGSLQDIRTETNTKFERILENYFNIQDELK